MALRGPDDAHIDVDADALGRALLAAHAADPGELIDRLRAFFLELPAALDLGLHLVDYRLASLRPVQTRSRDRLLRAEPIADSPLGEAFRLQRVTRQDAPAGVLHHVPVSVRGQRLGVLTGTFARAPSASDLGVLEALALAVAYSLLEASAGTDLYEVNRRHGRLSVAAEMQWQLLPARAYRTRDFYVAGHLEPALRVAGDAFDFVVDDGTLTLAVVDVTAAGGGPSLLTTLVITALRNARRSGLTLGEQASLASDIIWQQTAGREHASVLLMRMDAQAGNAVVVDAGSPVVLRMRDGRFDPLRLDAQTPLGMFDGTEYREEEVDLHPGDRAYLLTDGAFPAGRTMEHLIEIFGPGEQAAGHTPPESIRRLVAALTRGGEDPEDDITVMCLDWIRRES